MGYFKDTLKGISWMGTLRGTTRVIALVKIGVLARILNPIEFGVFGIATLVLEFLEIITETGINVVLIQGKSGFKGYINSAWVVSIIRGAIISLSLLILAVPVSNFFSSENSRSLLYLISIVPLLRGFINPSIVKFQKQLEFNKEFYFRFVIFVFDALIAIYLAFVLKSATSIVWGMVAGVILEVILSWLLVSPRPRFTLNIEKVKRVLNRGKWITLSGIFNYLFQNIDDIVVGKILNPYSLGLYQMAYKISTLPITEVGEVFHKVTFPVYVRIGGDRERLKKAFSKVTLVVSLFVIPFGLLLLMFPRQLILIFLGEKWLEVTSVLRILAFYGVIRAMISNVSPLFLAVKKQENITIYLFVGILGLGITIIPMVKRFGILGAGFSSLIGWFFALPVIFYFLAKVFSEKR